MSEHTIVMHGHMENGHYLYPCTLCDFKTTSDTQLSIHVKACHLKCEDCEEIVANLASMSVHINLMHGHMESIHKLYLCTLCEYKTSSEAQLSDHMKSYHMKYEM